MTNLDVTLRLLQAAEDAELVRRTGRDRQYFIGRVELSTSPALAAVRLGDEGLLFWLLLDGGTQTAVLTEAGMARLAALTSRVAA